MKRLTLLLLTLLPLAGAAQKITLQCTFDGLPQGSRIIVSEPDGSRLMAIDTLEAMAYGMKEKLGGQIGENDLLIPMIDARRMEVYAAIFDANLNKVEDTAALVIDEHSFENLSNDHHLWLFGDGAPKLTQLFENQPNISVIDGFKPSAAFMRPLAEKALLDKDFVDVAYFEPFYLKDFIAGKPHVKGL